MATAMLAERPMAKERRNTPVRIDDESLRWARIAASYKGLTLADYVSRALLEIAKRDVEQEHASLSGGGAVGPKAKGRGGKG